MPANGEQKEIGPDDGNPVQIPAATTAMPTYGLASMALSTSNSAEMKPSVPGNPTLARPVSRKTRPGSAMLVQAVVVGQREPAEACLQCAERQPEAAQRQNHGKPQASEAVSDSSVCSSSPTSTSEE